MEKADKSDKEAQKMLKNYERQQALEKQVTEDYEAKTKNGKSGTALDQLKVWLDNAPFKS